MTITTGTRTSRFAMIGGGAAVGLAALLGPAAAAQATPTPAPAAATQQASADLGRSEAFQVGNLKYTRGVHLTVTNKTKQNVHIAFTGNDDSGFVDQQILTPGQSAAHSDTYTMGSATQRVVAKVTYLDHLDTPQFVSGVNDPSGTWMTLADKMRGERSPSGIKTANYTMDQPGWVKQGSFDKQNYLLHRGADDTKHEYTKTFAVDVLGVATQ